MVTFVLEYWGFNKRLVSRNTDMTCHFETADYLNLIASSYWKSNNTMCDKKINNFIII